MTFLKKAFGERLRSFPERTDAVRRIEADRDRILAFLSDELDPSVKAASIHASDGDGLWETHTFRAEFDEERLIVGPVPHLYPLVKLADQSPLYAVCVADSKQARLVVCGLGEVLRRRTSQAPSRSTGRASPDGRRSATSRGSKTISRRTPARSSNGSGRSSRRARSTT